MVKFVVMLLMVLFAIMAVQSSNLKTAVIYSGIFSMTCSFAYLLYSAPDVAIAEAVIGCTLATVLYLVALQKYKVFNVCYVNRRLDTANDASITASKKNLLYLVEKYCAEKELDPYITYTTIESEESFNNYRYDIVIHHRDDRIVFYGRKRNYHVAELEGFIIGALEKGKKNVDCSFVIT